MVETDSSGSASDCHNESVVMPTPPSARRKHTDEEIDHCEFPGLSSIRSKRQHRIVPLKSIETEKQQMSSVSEDNISEDRRAIFPSTLTQTPQTSGRLLDDTRNRSTSSTDIQWKQKRPTVRISNSASTSKTATLDQTPRSSRRLSNDILEEGHTITNISQGTRSNMLSDDTFKRQVLRQLQILNIRQQQQSDDISMILQKVGVQDDENFIVEPDSIFTKFAFPLKTTEDLNTMEDFLSMEENSKRFVKELIGNGGSNYKAMINRILPKLLSNELAKLYSWIGRKGKRNFSILRLTAQILVAVQKTCKCSKNEIECRIKGWLVKSTEREKKKAAT